MCHAPKVTLSLGEVVSVCGRRDFFSQYGEKVLRAITINRMSEVMPTVVDVPSNQRLASVAQEYYSKGRVYAAEDVLRRQIIVVAQRMKHVQTAIEDKICGEPCWDEDFQVADVFILLKRDELCPRYARHFKAAM